VVRVINLNFVGHSTVSAIHTPPLAFIVLTFVLPRVHGGCRQEEANLR
jgi:hypothetical protein